MNRFHRDDDGQKMVRDLVIGPGLYGMFSVDGRYVTLDKGRMATILQKRFSVDTVLQARSGNAAFIEEKIIRWPVSNRAYTAFTLETKSCTVPGRESDGWMVYGEADWLNYALCQRNGDIVCYLIDFQKLKAAFWPAVDQFRETVTTQLNRTACRLVPIDWINEKVGSYVRVIKPTREGSQAVMEFNAMHYRRDEKHADLFNEAQ